jgi:hypothetical protein
MCLIGCTRHVSDESCIDPTDRSLSGVETAEWPSCTCSLFFPQSAFIFQLLCLLGVVCTLEAARRQQRGRMAEFRRAATSAQDGNHNIDTQLKFGQDGFQAWCE